MPFFIRMDENRLCHNRQYASRAVCRVLKRCQLFISVQSMDNTKFTLKIQNKEKNFPGVFSEEEKNLIYSLNRCFFQCQAVICLSQGTYGFIPSCFFPEVIPFQALLRK